MKRFMPFLSPPVPELAVPCYVLTAICCLLSLRLAPLLSVGFIGFLSVGFLVFFALFWLFFSIAEIEEYGRAVFAVRCAILIVIQSPWYYVIYVTMMSI